MFSSLRSLETVNGSPVTTVTGFLVDDLKPTSYAREMEELDGNNDPTLVYVHGHELLAERPSLPDGTFLFDLYYCYDVHGSVRFLTDYQAGLADVL
jgi:hypothetical protein